MCADVPMRSDNETRATSNQKMYKLYQFDGVRFNFNIFIKGCAIAIEIGVHFANNYENPKMELWTIQSIYVSVNAQSKPHRIYPSIDMSADDDIDCLQIELNLSLRYRQRLFVYIEIVNAFHPWARASAFEPINIIICYCYHHRAWYYLAFNRISCINAASASLVISVNCCTMPRSKKMVAIEHKTSPRTDNDDCSKINSDKMTSKQIIIKQNNIQGPDILNADMKWRDD